MPAQPAVLLRRDVTGEINAQAFIPQDADQLVPIREQGLLFELHEAVTVG